jgi:hypothetical protein
MKFPTYDENGDPILPEGVKKPESLLDVLAFQDAAKPLDQNPEK